MYIMFNKMLLFSHVTNIYPFFLLELLFIYLFDIEKSGRIKIFFTIFF